MAAQHDKALLQLHVLLCRRVDAGQEDSPLSSIFAEGWAASVTMTKCDVATAEDAAHLLGQQGPRGMPRTPSCTHAPVLTLLYCTA